MSFPALAWATTSKVSRAADKLVLLGLADRHNTKHELAYPSIAWLCEFSSLDRKTVVTALDRLEAGGFIADSGQRVGKTKQVKAYRLNLNSPENGTGKTEPLPEKDTVFSGEQSQKRDTDTALEPKEAKASYIKGLNLDPWLPAEAWLALMRSRKSLMPKVAFGEDAARGIYRKLSKLRDAGYDPEKLLWKAVDHGWRTVFENDDCKATLSGIAAGPVDWESKAKAMERIGQHDAAAEFRRKRPVPVGNVVGEILRRAQA